MFSNTKELKMLKKTHLTSREVMYGEITAEMIENGKSRLYHLSG